MALFRAAFVKLILMGLIASPSVALTAPIRNFTFSNQARLIVDFKARERGRFEIRYKSFDNVDTTLFVDRDLESEAPLIYTHDQKSNKSKDEDSGIKNAIGIGFPEQKLPAILTYVQNQWFIINQNGHVIETGLRSSDYTYQVISFSDNKAIYILQPLASGDPVYVFNQDGARIDNEVIDENGTLLSATVPDTTKPYSVHFQGVNPDGQKTLERLNFEDFINTAFSRNHLIESDERYIPIEDNDGDTVNAWDIVDTFSTDLTLLEEGDVFKMNASELKLAKNLADRLLKKEMNSAAVLASAGRGKSQFLRSFVYWLKTKGPVELRDYNFLEFDASSFASGTKYVGATESKLKAMFAVSEKSNTVFFIDEVHLLKGMGTSSENSNDIRQNLKPKMATGEFTAIGFTTPDEFETAYSGDPAFMERMRPFPLPNLSENDIVDKLQNWSERHGKPKLRRKLLHFIFTVSDEFNAIGGQPRNAAELLDTVLVNKSQWDADRLTEDDILAVAKEAYKVDLAMIDDEAADQSIRRMQEAFSQHVGDDHVKEELIRLRRRHIAGLNNTNHVAIAMAIFGPKGQGKSSVVQAYAKAIGRKYVEINMAIYRNGSQSEIREVLNIIAKAAQEDAFAVIFLDEIEKSHIAIQNALLTITSSGRFSVQRSVNGSAQSTSSIEVSAKNMTLVAAGNAGSQFWERAKPGQVIPREVIEATVTKDNVSSPLIDRMDSVVVVLPKVPQQQLLIIDSMIDRKLRRLQEQGIRVEISNQTAFVAAVQALARGSNNSRMQGIGFVNNYTPATVASNRPFEHLIDKYVDDALLDLGLSRRRNGVRRSKIQLRWSGGKLIKEPSAQQCRKVFR